MTNYNETKWDYSYKSKPKVEDYLEKGFKITKVANEKFDRKEQKGTLIPHITKTKHKGKNFVKTKALERLGLINESRDIHMNDVLLSMGVQKLVKESDPKTKSLYNSFAKSDILLEDEVKLLGKFLKVHDFATPDVEELLVFEQIGYTIEEYNKDVLEAVYKVLKDYKRRGIIKCY